MVSAPMAASPSSLKTQDWFGTARPAAHRNENVAVLAKLGIAIVVGGLFYMAGHHTVAYIAWGVGGTISAVSLASASLRNAIDGAFAKLGYYLGLALGNVLLGGIYLLVVTPMKYVRRLMGADDLHIRDGKRTTFWLTADDEERKARWVGSMFATESLAYVKSGGGVVRTLLMGVALLALAEGVLRLKGFGHPVLYVADPLVGYYTAPNMNLGRYGGLVQTNQFGMRSEPVEKTKPPGVFRILMLGDSTLYGGSYIDQHELYSSQLGQHLNALVNKPGSPSRKVEILAMGVNGWGPYHETGYINKFGVFDADLVIINMPIDDINRPLYGLMSAPFFGVDRPPYLALEEVVNHLAWRYRSQHAGLNDAWEQEQSVMGIKQYGVLVDELKRRGVPEVIAAILPNVSAGMGGAGNPREARWLQELLDIFKAHGARTYYAQGAFKDAGPPDVVYYDEVHLAKKGHAVYARWLAEHLPVDSMGLSRWIAGEPAPPVHHAAANQPPPSDPSVVVPPPPPPPSPPERH